MLFHRFEDEDLSHYSYAVGCEGAGELAIVDPRRDVDVYVDFADQHDLEITRVLETHIHADFASGARELARRTGATLHVSAHDRGERFEVAFEHADLRHGESVELGSVRLEAVHTPGHTPEHLSYLVYDGSRSKQVPMLFLTGDFLFVGSLGRPDLLGEQAKRELARALFESVRRVLPGLPDGLEVHPAHGAGSMCGAGMSGRPMSTLGFERIANPYLDPRLERDEFVERILGSVPPFPDYYRRMKRVNSEGPAILDGLPGRTPLGLERFTELAGGEAVIVDLRHHLAFGGGHVPGSFGIGNRSLSTWAAWVVPYDRPILLVADEPPGDQVERAVRSLVRVGLDGVAGFLDGGIAAWIGSGRPVSELHQTTPSELHRRRAAGEPVHVLDVRTGQEYERGHVEGAIHVHGGQVADRLDEIPQDDRPLAVICGSGYRSTVAASVLERAGRERLINVTGGMRAWARAGLPTVSEEPARA